jgi:two-component system CheB/CheR fusion protein
MFDTHSPIEPRVHCRRGVDSDFVGRRPKNLKTETSLVGNDETPNASASGFPIVGIGASAGGLDAFRRLLGALPSATGMAYVFVQHLEPNHESILTELLSQLTRMVVMEVGGDVLVERNHVYVIPPASDLIFADGTLKLIARDFSGAAHLPIDSFLQTLAKAQGSQAIGVVLSGMGSDGTLGLAAIEAAGGIAFVQAPSSAKHDEMPLNALAYHGVHFVLTPEDIAAELTRLAEHPYLARVTPGPYSPESRVVALGSGPEPSSNDQADSRALDDILEGLKKASGTSFAAYKKTTLRRRVARRMAVVRVETLTQYARCLEEDPRERALLYDDCLISVTSFFRDAEVFRALEQQCSALLKERGSYTPFRVWVAGCATGEETYTIAMCLLDGAREMVRNPALQIFSTDLSERALAKAREGLYAANIVNEVSADRLGRFFVQNGDHFRINKFVREMCVFARHDLTRDPPYSHLDLISCRNVLIYLEPALQEMVLATFHYALRPGGLLLLGPAETVSGVAGLFSPVDEQRRLYMKLPGSGPPRLLSAQRDTSSTWTAFEQPTRKITRSSEVLKEADRTMLTRFAPAAVVVDENCNVLEFRGDTDPFLEHAHGRATLQLEQLLRRGLLLDLREIKAEVKATGSPVRRSGLRVRNRQQLQSVTLEVMPIKGRVAAENCLLIVFEAESLDGGTGGAHATQSESGDNKDKEIERLNSGLGRATDHMHTLVREHETAVAELQATTEEALSNNEELQSLNEELQTAKEEIQSTNEELATLNQELHDRNTQLALLNDKIQHGLDSANALVDTVPLPLLILDHDLRVQTANLAFYEVFRTTAPWTRGRLLAELADGQWAQPQLLSSLEQLVLNGQPLCDLIVEAAFPSIGQRTMSLNARRIQADRSERERVLLSIEDRTAIIRAEQGQEALLALEQKARLDAEAADHLKDQFVAAVSHELRGPLSVISGWVDVLTVEPKDMEEDTLPRALAAIRRGLLAQKRMISELLDHSRFVMGKVVLDRSTVDLVSIAEGTMIGIRAAAEAKDISVSLSHDSPTCFVRGDAERLQQVVWNLLLNAVKFTPTKGRVHASIGRAQNQVHFTVTDTGIGISSEFLPHVFERFRQAEGSSNRSQRGLGLGLKLVSELVELHGGTVQAHSPGLGLGATFVVVLPIPALLLELSVEDQLELEGSVSRFPSTPPESLWSVNRDFLAGTRLLVVDDEHDARDALVGLLELYGAHVRSASSVAEAMTELEIELPHVLISDIGLPLEDGYELMRRLHALEVRVGRRVPAIAVSAYPKDSNRGRALKAGFQTYLEKPVTPRELMKAVIHLSKLVS